ncbi:type II toxin-antitoxin system RelE/ParE family toxin [Sulfurospirillum barnesii]|uniref:Plasmid stabilization system protein n=2 Tax=Sulfurospirillum barnesii TaxID=44674 RepID=I3XV64_SULBS|nr:type II toxin-antitoxin system RelE/ParE family toxin [Sulfurospirillum barnesii]AAN31664.1 unknown [Sulfurospirillum barnesii SES-3]AFL67838.1 plasmid stabilization system protein [Sulfurospirillum barnesii SES-3]
MKTYNVYWTQSSQSDLEYIIEYLKRDSVSLAKKMFLEIKEACDALYVFPERKRVVPELHSIGIIHYREIIYKRWRIVFKIEQTSVYVVLIADSSRNFEDLLLQRLLK